MVEIDSILVNDWYIVCKTGDIQPGNIRPVRLLGEDIIVWRGNSPQAPVLAWQDWCPHRGVALSQGNIVGDRLACRYHGWQYENTGKCVHIPSQPTQPLPNTCVKTYQCQENRGFIWVSLGNPEPDVPPFPDWDNPDYRQVICGPYRFSVSAFRVIENNFDLSHVAFLHDNTIGDSRYPLTEKYDVQRDENGVKISNLQYFQVDATYTGVRTLSKAIMRTITIDHPLMMRSIREMENSSDRVSLVLSATPIEEDSCLVWLAYVLNYGRDVPDSQFYESTEEYMREDISMLESQRPACLPLLPRSREDSSWPAEKHVEADKASIAYRRWLKDLGITFGVC